MLALEFQSHRLPMGNNSVTHPFAGPCLPAGLFSKAFFLPTVLPINNSLPLALATSAIGSVAHLCLSLSVPQITKGQQKAPLISGQQGLVNLWSPINTCQVVRNGGPITSRGSRHLQKRHPTKQKCARQTFPPRLSLSEGLEISQVCIPSCKKC